MAPAARARLAAPRRAAVDKLAAASGRRRQAGRRQARVVARAGAGAERELEHEPEPEPERRRLRRGLLAGVALLAVAESDARRARRADAAEPGFAVGGAASDEEDDYVYTTKDLAVDLASPLVAYRVVSTALRQEVPAWLDAIILIAALGAAYVVFTGIDVLDPYLA